MKAIASKIINTDGVLTVKNEFVEIGDYKDYYKHLDCSTFDIVMVRWRGKDVSIFLDDEGMMKEGNVGRIVDGYPQPLFGNFVFTGGVDNYGNTLPIPDNFNLMDLENYVSGIEFSIGG